MKTQTLTVQEARDQRDAAIAELEAIQARAEAAYVRTVARPLLEGYDPVPTVQEAYIPPSRDEFAYSDPAKVSSVGRGVIRSRTLRRDRADGHFAPVYETEQELAYQRMDGRVLGCFDTIALGAIEALTNYTIGTGIVVDVTRSKEYGQTVPDETLRAVKRFVRQFVDDNDLSGSLDREIHASSREDGERFVEICAHDGALLLDSVEPDEVTEPFGKRDLEDWLYETGQMSQNVVPSWTYGILTDKRHTGRPIGYHVVRDEGGQDWDFVPAERMVHFKRNVHRKAKRGVSDLFTPGPDIESHGKLKTNIGVGAAVQAAIAYIRQHPPGITKSDIVGFVGNNASTTYTRSTANGTETRNVEHLRPGSVKDIPSGMEYQAGPMGSPQGPLYVTVAQYLLRISGVRWSMAEYMISGDASNGNFSSTLVAESPFVKARENDQAHYGAKFREIISKAIRIAARLGRFGQNVDPDDLLLALDVIVNLPTVATRDRMANAQANEILHRNGILSKPTWAAMSDLDYREEQEKGAGPQAPGLGAGPLGNSPALEALGAIYGSWRSYP